MTRSDEAIDEMGLNFLRRQLPNSDSVVPQTIVEALPLQQQVVEVSLARLHQAGAIEGVTVQEVDYPVRVTGVN